MSGLNNDGLGRSGSFGSVRAESIDADEGSIKNKFDREAITSDFSVQASVTQLSYGGLRWIDDDQFTGRLFQDYWCWDGPPYNSSTRVRQPADGEGGYGMPSGAHIALTYDDYIFAVDEQPLTLYRSPYSDAFSSGSYSWSTVLTGQTGSQIQSGIGDWPFAFSVDKDTGVMLIGEETPDNDEAVLYRSTDSGATWTEVYRLNNTVDFEYHSVVPDPYVDGHWIAALGDNSDQRFLESGDGGQSWTQTNLAPTAGGQAVGVSFGPGRIYFAEDRGQAVYGPWFVDRETGNTGMVAAEHPQRSFSDYVGNDSLEYSIHYDESSNIIYGLERPIQSATTNSPSGYKSFAFWYCRGVGDDPKLLYAGGNGQFYAGDNHIISKDIVLPKLTSGGV